MVEYLVQGLSAVELTIFCTPTGWEVLKKNTNKTKKQTQQAKMTGDMTTNLWEQISNLIGSDRLFF